jgi:hypothetical protein
MEKTQQSDIQTSNLCKGSKTQIEFAIWSSNLYLEFGQ